MARRLVVRLDRCIGCRACEAACRSRYKGEARIRLADLTSEVRLPMACRHCEQPLCVAACPFDVIRRDSESGLVIQAGFHCVGCRSCALACPFGVIESSLMRRIAQKCSLCGDRAGGPRCAATCPAGALDFVEVEPAAELAVGVGFVARSEHGRRK
jgi:Fe-S-cluster-containing hydrogenase component 2